MRLLTEEEIRQLLQDKPPIKKMQDLVDILQRVAKAQRDLTHKETLKAVIKDLEMIMKEAPDLKSLEKMIAGYITEKRGEMPEEGK